MVGMRFRFCNFFVRLGSAPVEENNFLAIEHHRSTCLVRVAALAEQFDAALAFYMDVSVAMRAASDGCWFELRRRTKKRLPAEAVKGTGIVGYTQEGALYGSIGSDDIRALLNEYWLSDRFRMIGTSRIPVSAAVALAIELDDKDLSDELLPTNVMFVLEIQYLTGESYLVALVDESALESTRELISRAATRLLRPLLEVGPRAWPPT